jgi:hypothetical protein
MQLHRSLFTLLAGPLFTALLLLSGCASLDPRPAPMSREDIVALAKSGAPPADVIDRLRQSRTVLPLSATDILQLSGAGVPREVLDYLQAAQVADLRQRLQFNRFLYGPELSPFPRCGGFGRAPFNRYGSPYWPYC